MSYRGWLLGVLLVSGGPLAAEGEFPIGAWFPGMVEIKRDEEAEEAEEAEWATRLDSVKAQGFNTIHARQGRGELRTSKYNRARISLAHARGLKVQLGSWRQPTKWRSFSRNYSTRVFEAENNTPFACATGRVTHGDTTARYAATGEHGAGLLLASEGSVYLRRPPPDPGDEQLTLTGDTPEDDGSPLTRYQYRHSTDGGTTWAPDWRIMPGSTGTTTGHGFGGLTNGTPCTFEIRAPNGAGDGAVAQATPPWAPLDNLTRWRALSR